MARKMRRKKRRRSPVKRRRRRPVITSSLAAEEGLAQERKRDLKQALRAKGRLRQWGTPLQIMICQKIRTPLRITTQILSCPLQSQFSHH